MAGVHNIKLISIAFIVILVLTSLNFQLSIENSKNSCCISHLEKEEKNNKPDYRGFRGRSIQLENNAHGGSWEDTFNDNSKIDLGMTDYIRLISGNARTNNSVFLDPYTIALWHFDEGMGTTTFDDTGNGHVGVLGGDGLGSDLPAWTTGKYGYGLNFDGSNDYVDGNYDAKGLLNELTFTAWAKPDSFNGLDLVVGGFWQTSPDRAINLRRHLTGKWQFIDASYANVYSNNNAQTGIWTHLAGTIDSSGNMKMYINGVLQSDTTSGASASRLNKFVYMGWSSYSDSAQYFNGIIDEVSISKKARTPLEIKDIYENGTGVNITQANLTSEEITLPPGMNWDSIFIDSTKVGNSYINVTILNATDNQPISGIQKFTNNGEFDISTIDYRQYPSIKLNATFDCDGYTTPILHYWSVSWNETNTWHDTIFGNVKVESYNLVDTIDGNAEFQNTGTLRSKTIIIPDKCYYDKLRINKTEPTGTSLKVTILDAQSNTGVPGFKNLTSNILDLSGLEPKTYPAIKLKATYSAPGAQLGKLHDWSINWTKNSPPKVLDYNSIQALNRTQSAVITINLSDVNENEDELILEIAYKSPFDSTWKINYLTNPTYVNDHWECTFTPPADAKIGLYSFQITCTDLFQEFDEVIMMDFIEVFNNHPIILDIESSQSILKRTESIKINIDVFDVETSQNDLDIKIKYKSKQHQDWEYTYISNLQYSTDHWEADFTPKKDAHLGIYTLNITCSDSLFEVFNNIVIEVKNNKPTQSDVIILPFEPKTIDYLTVLVANTTDIETSLRDLEYWYYWYRDDYLISEFENKTTIPSTSTSKNEIWRCEVYPFDGDETGPRGEADVIIRNSPPTLVFPFNNYELYEDSPVILKNKFKEIFRDPDNDILTFNALGQKNIIVEITQANGTIKLTPAENWFGTEYIRFYASDSVASAETMVEVIVKPTNDLPKITRIGSQIISSETPELEFAMDEDKWLNLTIHVKDIDGDVERKMVMYFLNITERANLYFNDNITQLVFNPDNADVGWHYLNIQITDNNETPTMYISQNFKIQVRNINDPPTVEIIFPVEGQIFSKKDKINFKCKTKDIDFLVPNPNEKLSYKWSADVIGYSDLGTTKNLTNISLQSGQYNITVEVTDSGKLKAYDTIKIIVKEVPKKKESDTLQSLSLAIIGIIIIILIIFLFVNYQKKQRLATMGMPNGQVIQPDASYTPPGMLRTAPVPIRRTSPSVPYVQPQAQLSSVRPQLQSQPVLAPTTYTIKQPAQLPPAQPPTPVPSVALTPTPQSIKTELTTQQKLKLLEERLLRGEIDQELYENLKTKYEFEAKPAQPPPRLPSVSSPPSTSPTITQPSLNSTINSASKDTSQK